MARWDQELADAHKKQVDGQVGRVKRIIGGEMR